MKRASERHQRTFQHLQLQARSYYDDDAYPECGKLLLVLHPAIRGEQHVEVALCTT